MSEDDSLLQQINRQRLDGTRGFLQDKFFPIREAAEYSHEKLFIGWEYPQEWVAWDENKGAWEVSSNKWRPFFIDISQSIVSLSLGSRGVGKSWLLRGMLSRLKKAGYNCAHVSDIKNEMWSNNFPSLAKYSNLFDKKRHEVPEAIPTKVLLPYFLQKTYHGNIPEGNKLFQLSFRDITERDLVTLLGFEDDRDKIEIIKKIYLAMTELKITNFEDMIDFIDDMAEVQASSKKKLILTIENLKEAKVLGDEYHQEIEEILKEGNVLSLNLKGYDEFASGYSQCYVGFVVNQLRRLRRNGMLKRPLYLFVDEAHAFCPNKGNPPSKKEFIDVINIDRLAGVSLILASQYPEQLPKDDILKQITHFFLPFNIDPETMKFVLDLVGLKQREDMYSDKWKKFFAKLHRFEWCYIDRNNPVPRKIRPAAPLCRHTEEMSF